MSSRLIIDPKGVPVVGLQFQGHLHSSVFELPEGDPVKPISPLNYDLYVIQDDNDIIATGEVNATFELICGRCTGEFAYRVELEPYTAALETEKDRPIDLTTTLREDILLALPAYPRCEIGNVSPRRCPSEGKFDTPQEPLLDDKPDDGSGDKAWEALDKLNPPNSNQN